MTRIDLIKRLMELERPGEKKLTRVQARGLVKAFFDSMAEALQRGEEVEMPFGRLDVAEHDRKPVRGWFLGRVRVTYRKRKFVRFVATQGFAGSRASDSSQPNPDPVSYTDAQVMP